MSGRPVRLSRCRPATGRSFATTRAARPHRRDELPAELQLRWTRTLPAPRPAFPSEVRLAYDASYEPVVLGHTMFVPSMVTDSVTALDTETGAERWRFITGGPVRFAPVAWEGKVYFVSDDGYLYCLNDDGSLRWKFRGLPEGRRGPQGAGTWAAGLVVAGSRRTRVGRRRGLFRRGPLAHRGRVRPRAWMPSRARPSGRTPTCDRHPGKQLGPRPSGEKAGLTPQGYLAIVGDRLIVPCGTATARLPGSEDGQAARPTRRAGAGAWGCRKAAGSWPASASISATRATCTTSPVRNDERLAKTKPGDAEFQAHALPGRMDAAGHRTGQPTRTRPLSPAGDDARSDVRERRRASWPAI